MMQGWLLLHLLRVLICLPADSYPPGGVNQADGGVAACTRANAR
jgi:hypothetical protein